WINLHGMEAIISGLDGDGAGRQAASLPQDQWDSIAKTTRDNYLNDFTTAMRQLKGGAPPSYNPFKVQGGEVYYNNTRLNGADSATFRSLNNFFAKDKYVVLFEHTPIPGADPETFKLQSCGNSEVNAEDKNRCYWFNHPVPCDCKPHDGREFPSGW